LQQWLQYFSWHLLIFWCLDVMMSNRQIRTFEELIKKAAELSAGDKHFAARLEQELREKQK